ncbi:MAG: ABC transporter permease, partial [Anaerolineae bacterium]|nr:ABC transporter permease [Anaerolineae bacterium]
LHMPLVVANQSLDSASHAYISAVVASGYFDVADYVPDQDSVIAAIDRGDAHAGIVIPPDFAANVARDQAQVLLLVDGSDLFISQSAYNALTAIAQTHTDDVLLGRISRTGLFDRAQLLPVEARVRVLYNPNIDDLWFLIPGMAAMLLQTQTIALTAAAVVREREMGTIEQLLVTPILPGELLLGKIAPNCIIAFVNMLTVMALSVYWFNVPFRGNFWLFLGLAFLYVFSGLGLGLLVSTVSQSQKQSQQLAAVIMLLGIVVGGVIFPRYKMPLVIRLIGYLFPLTYFIPIARGIITKGVGIEYFWDSVFILVIYIVMTMFFAIQAFHQSLD